MKWPTWCRSCYNYKLICSFTIFTFVLDTFSGRSCDFNCFFESYKLLRYLLIFSKTITNYFIDSLLERIRKIIFGRNSRWNWVKIGISCSSIIWNHWFLLANVIKWNELHERREKWAKQMFLYLFITIQTEQIEAGSLVTKAIHTCICHNLLEQYFYSFITFLSYNSVVSLFPLIYLVYLAHNTESYN